GRPIEFTQYPFDTLLDGLNRGDIDLAMNGLEIRPANQAKARFTRPYYVYQLQLVARRGEKRFRTIEECRSQDLTVATLGGTEAERLLKDSGVPCATYDDQESLYRDLQQRQAIAAVLLDLPAAIYYAAPDRHLKYGRKIEGLQFAGSPFAPGYYGIAVRKG